MVAVLDSVLQLDRSTFTYISMDVFSFNFEHNVLLRQTHSLVTGMDAKNLKAAQLLVELG